MRIHIQSLQPKSEGKWELNRYKTNLLLDKNVKSELENFLNHNFDGPTYFKNNGNARRYCCLNQQNTPVTDLLLAYRKFVFQQIGINFFEEEPMLGIFLGVNSHSGFIQEHIDSAKHDFYHVRMNFLLSKPFQGGVPMIREEYLDIQENESWLLLASEWPHNSTPVIGKKPRVVLSLGALVEKNQIDPILKEMGIE